MNKIKVKLKIKKVKWLEVVDPKYSDSCVPLGELDFKDWWVDNSFGEFYLHVKRKKEDTKHRVYCKKSRNPRIG